ncbi:hypothetical protein C8N46_107195 [Kordia periserrulae]|uniref:50S ribosomal protein L27 n=1 Tax=Kordia periserrulae TaxID=701523 RepID=A0A2T6BVT0_9FLAO|nr:hypothetical protein [Kordia periserrulae]PTX60188.1 hypothetical protein C8N46_107195 [Kordia periserrulae]
MYDAIKTLHSYFAYFVLLMLIVAVVNAIIGFTTNKKFTAKDLRISLFALIFTHLQLVVGIILYFVSLKGFTMIQQNGMKLDSASRLLALEHPLVGILAIIFITIGWSKHKKQETAKRAYGKIALFYGIGLLLILSRLPWKDWWNLY